MIIPEELLLQKNAYFFEVKKDEYIFLEDDPALHYYQVISGAVKMTSFSEGGNESP